MRKYFQGLSLSSIVAGALAAVTSFLLAAKIGIAGSVIGAAASYIVSTVATNIYKNAIIASRDKLQSVGEGSPGGEDEQTVDGNVEKAQPASSDDSPLDSATPSGAADGMAGTVIDETNGKANPSAFETDTRVPRSISSQPMNERTYSVSEMRRHRTHNTKRTTVIVTLISGLLAVAVTAGIVMLLTEGKGTDTVVHDLVTQTTTPPEHRNMPSTPSGNGEDSNSVGTDSPESNADGSSDTNDSDSSTDAGSGTDAGSSSTGTGSDHTNGSAGTSSSGNSASGSSAGTTDSGDPTEESTDSGSPTGTEGSSHTGANENE